MIDKTCEVGATDARWQPMVALVERFRAYAEEWNVKRKDAEQSPAFVQGVYSTWHIAADELEAALQSGAGEPDALSDHKADARWQPRAHCDYCGQSIAIERGKAAVHYDCYPLRLCEGGNRKPINGVVKVGPR